MERWTMPVLEAICATFERIHRKHVLVRGGESRDGARYGVTDDEWPGVRGWLASRFAARGTDAATLRAPGIP